MGAVIASATLFASATVVSMLATTEPDAVRVPDPDTVSPGFAGFLVVFFLAVATVLLIRSMTRRVRKVNAMAGLDEPLDEARRADEEEAQSQGSGSARKTPRQG